MSSLFCERNFNVFSEDMTFHSQTNDITINANPQGQITLKYAKTEMIDYNVSCLRYQLNVPFVA